MYYKQSLADDEDDSLYHDIYTRIEDEKRVRDSISAKWVELWHMYKTQPLQVMSDGEWHSKLNDGRVFEIVETVGSYIRNALFFSDNWVDLEAQEPGLAEVVPFANAYFRDCLNQSNIKREFRLYIAQLLLLGTSAMSVYWDKDERLCFECLNMYDVHIESSRRYSHKYSYSFRETELNYAEFIDMFALFNHLETKDVEEAFEELADASERTDRDDVDLRDTIDMANERWVELVEYYCPIENELYYYVESECIGQRSCDRCPWIISTLYETPENAYGLSLVDSSFGLILENNVLMNRRLDNIAISIDNMWMFIDDGVTNPDEIKTEPGKIITVGRPDSLVPLRPPSNNFNVTYTEAQVLDTKIDRNIGTGAMISANAYRTGERVTATEIQSVKDAGGNRLTDLYEHIENVCILPLLHTAFEIVRKYTKKPKTVKIEAGEQNIYDYFQMLPEDLRHDYRVKLRATQNVINRERNIKMLSDFLLLIANVPQFQEMVNYQNLFYDLLVKFGFDNPGRYIMQKQEETAEPAPTSPLEDTATTLESIAPGTGASAFQGAVAGGQLPDLAAAYSGQAPGAVPTDDPALNQQITAAASLPI